MWVSGVASVIVIAPNIIATLFGAEVVKALLGIIDYTASQRLKTEISIDVISPLIAALDAKYSAYLEFYGE